MCGRFTLRTPTPVLARQFQLGEAPDLPPRYNIAPTQPIATVRVDPANYERKLEMLRWGLIPSWIKEASKGAPMINARAETAAEKPFFRAAFKRRRCLVLADGWYEWKRIGGKKQPYLLHLPDDEPFAFAGLWETWQDPQNEEASPLESCTIITTSANEQSRDVHDRMPVILGPNSYEEWLDPQLHDRKTLEAHLNSYGGKLIIHPVSPRVNRTQNDDPECIVAGG